MSIELVIVSLIAFAAGILVSASILCLVFTVLWANGIFHWKT